MMPAGPQTQPSRATGIREGRVSGVPLALLAVLAVTLAGCSEGSDTPSAAPGSTTVSEGPLGNASVDAPLPTLVALPIDWSGHTKEGAWLCSDQDGTGQCMAGQQVAPDGQHVNGVAYAGNMTLLDVNLTWQAAPGQNGLVVAAYGNVSTGRVLLSHVRGLSPLNLRLDAAALDGVVPDGLLVFMVWPEGKTATQPSLYVDASQQPFQLEGVLRSTVPP
jgi:hypothetical protein